MMGGNIVGHLTAKDLALSPLCERPSKGLGNTKAKTGQNRIFSKIEPGTVCAGNYPKATTRLLA